MAELQFAVACVLCRTPQLSSCPPPHHTHANPTLLGAGTYSCARWSVPLLALSNSALAAGCKVLSPIPHGLIFAVESCPRAKDHGREWESLCWLVGYELTEFFTVATFHICHHDQMQTLPWQLLDYAAPNSGLCQAVRWFAVHRDGTGAQIACDCLHPTLRATEIRQAGLYFKF